MCIFYLVLFASIACVFPNSKCHELPRVVSNHRSTVASIENVLCSFEIEEYRPDGVLVFRGDYAKSDGAVRVRYIKGNVRVEQYVNENRLVVTRKCIYPMGVQPKVEILRYDDAPLELGDIWMLGLLKFTAPDGASLVPLDRLWSLGTKVLSCDWIKNDGKIAFQVEAAHKAAHMQFWLDPDNGLMVNKHVVRSTDNVLGIHSEFEIRKFQKFAQGISFPRVATVKNYQYNKMIHSQIIKVFDIKVNTMNPPSAKSLEIGLPRGAIVVDKIHNATYATSGSEYSEISESPGVLVRQIVFVILTIVAIFATLVAYRASQLRLTS